CIAIRQIVTSIGRDHFINEVQVDQTHGGGDLNHLAVGAHVDHIVETGESEVAHQAHLFGERIVVRENGTALETVEELGGMKTQNFACAEISNHRATA